MSYALGQPVPITITITDANRVPADATTVTLTVTRPDGTVDTFTTSGGLSHPATGVYQVDYVAPDAGLYAVRWVAAGANASAPQVDSFYVDQASLPPLVALAEAREHLNFADTTRDAQLAVFLQVASGLAESYTGRAWRRQTITATFPGGTDLLRLRPPILAVTSVTDDATLLDADTYGFDAARGWLYLTTGARWSGPVDVVHVAGPLDGVVPEYVRQGVLVQVHHLWETQRGASGAPRRGPDSEWSPALGFSVPRRVQELWDHERVPLVA